MIENIYGYPDYDSDIVENIEDIKLDKINIEKDKDLKNVNRLRRAFGFVGILVGSILLPIAFFPISIPLIIVGGYMLCNGLVNLLVKM